MSSDIISGANQLELPNGWSKEDGIKTLDEYADSQRSATRPDNLIEGFLGYIIGWVWELIDEHTEGYVVLHAQLSCPVLASFAPTFTVWEDSLPVTVSVHKCAVCHGT